ncbi:DUF1357 family protein [Borreliella americana]|uniref:DUF1357 family protein n=1 Tax=Borreliella americana TaxID=478807 RepID=UPI001E3ACA45|nr:DUF1357 family protein [Borreliella americana]MCD2332403.1 DUF1357 family protein [Borreliella americana]MCD2349223.1 DUF1357 family protein [Borreliella americana]MCD2381929.1 DUF1357 family protein [Borreliella americana]
MEKMATSADKNSQEDLKDTKGKNNEVLSDALIREFLEYKNLKSENDNLTGNYSHNDLREFVEINKLANDNLSFEYNTENLLAKGYSFKEVVKGQAEELIRKYVKLAQIFAVAGTCNLEEIDPRSRAILIRLAKTNIDQNKNSENSYKVINFQRIKVDQKNNLRDSNAFFGTYHDLRKAMLNQWEEIKNEFYCNKKILA